MAGVPRRRRRRGASLPWQRLEDWMGEPLTLFDVSIDENARPLADPDVPSEGKARATDPATSQAAALAHPGPRAQLRGLILDFFFAHPRRMFTDDELRAGLDQWTPTLTGHHPGSIIRRRGELVEGGWLCSAGFTRCSDHGVPMTVWRLTFQAIAQGNPHVEPDGNDRPVV